jgi:hypothetical protein
MDNLNVYRESLKYKDEVNNSLKSVSHILNTLKTRIYTPELIEMDMKYTSYKEGNLEFKDYITYLITKAKERGVDIKTYSNILLLNKTLDMEKALDFAKANKERDKLIDAIGKRSSKADMEELVLKTVEFKSEKINTNESYNRMLWIGQ